MVLNSILKHCALLLCVFYVVNTRRIVPAKIKANNEYSSPVITLEDGKIQGREAKTVGLNKAYYAFQGIPFAKPPLGELRFKPPVKNSKWEGVLNATQDKADCVQGSDPPTGSEDCLYINVYTPTLNSTGLAVMVWIYGGTFISGTSAYKTYGPDYLLDENVVYVSFNYRLGVFGFISTEDLVCPGNIGLKDQVLALKWVQSNINYFGGDPKKVTIFSESAGAVSTSYLLQSNLTKGLYRAAIMESGTSLCFWGLERRAKETAFAIGTSLRVNTTNSKTLTQGLRDIDYTTLQNMATVVSFLIAFKNPLLSLPFAPVKEPYHEGAIIYNKSEGLLSRGEFQRVPTIIGFNSNEGAAFVPGDIPALLRVYLLKYDLIFTDLVPVDLTKNQDKKVAAGVDIKLFYFGLIPLALQTDSVVKYISDDAFNRPIRQTVIEQSKYAPTYFYKFSFEGMLGENANKDVKGVGHAEELGYIFRKPNQTYAAPPTDTQVRSMLVRLWTNFAKYTNPTPRKEPALQNVTWLPANAVRDNLIYLNIDTDLGLELNPFNKEMKFWDGIYRKYGDSSYDTY